MFLLPSCFDKKAKDPIPAHVFSMIKYLDSNRITEFEHTRFLKKVNWGNNEWRFGGSGYISYTYKIGFPDQVPTNYTFPRVDSLERIEIMDKEAFVSAFPLKLNLPLHPVEMTLNQKGKVDVVNHWSVDIRSQKRDTLYSGLTPEDVFVNKNPFDYLELRTRKMDSLGIEGLGKNPFTNSITVTIYQEEGYLEYLPDNLIVNKGIKERFDSILATGKKINKNWTWINREKKR